MTNNSVWRSIECTPWKRWTVMGLGAFVVFMLGSSSIDKLSAPTSQVTKIEQLPEYCACTRAALGS